MKAICPMEYGMVFERLSVNVRYLNNHNSYRQTSIVPVLCGGNIMIESTFKTNTSIKIFLPDNVDYTLTPIEHHIKKCIMII
jgi:hypothetical protein